METGQLLERIDEASCLAVTANGDALVAAPDKTLRLTDTRATWKLERTIGKPEDSTTFADRVRSATRVDRFYGSPVPNFFRKPYGAGWALVGDAGYTKDPITAQGINDAFRDAERCATALHEAFSGSRPFDEAMGDYQRSRDEHVLGTYEFTCQLATLEPPPPPMQQMFGAIHGNQAAMDAFAQMNAGTISPAEFGAIVGAAHGPA